jgi:hypothetical protein
MVLRERQQVQISTILIPTPTITAVQTQLTIQPTVQLITQLAATTINNNIITEIATPGYFQDQNIITQDIVTIVIIISLILFYVLIKWKQQINDNANKIKNQRQQADRLLETIENTNRPI